MGREITNNINDGMGMEEGVYDGRDGGMYVCMDGSVQMEESDDNIDKRGER